MTLLQARAEAKRAADKLAAWERKRAALLSKRAESEAEAASGDALAVALLGGFDTLLEGERAEGLALGAACKRAEAGLERWRAARAALAADLERRELAFAPKREVLPTLKAALENLQAGGPVIGGELWQAIDTVRVVVLSLETSERWIKDARADLAEGGRFYEPEGGR